MTALLDKLLDDVIWEALDTESADTLDMQATHRGILRIEEFELAIYRCSNGEVAFDCEDLERFFSGCPLCGHSIHCASCNPTEADRARGRVGLLLSNEKDEAESVEA
jgi:hypothetical protein